ncbi:MAG: NAD(P) transhydrogenase subunit alpha [Candidatus Actinomarina sp.]|nr:NAD(P) transhydrogenase subunit alpha [Candidatus Actinomarina sp.]MDG1228471.1 NAD(P) transhydrogenase subunit alpha [Candidatus Actinomarina sp.]MDG1740519.1 NAD(P) transhydrogenase subunit alpha [Candidatus Actinomarina sp.]|tara:strand:- start:2361 stop:2648 length:288 start_codon:yes stop_codon:yes gene_type:complete
MTEIFLYTLLITVMASFIGYELISKIPQTLHTPLMSGSNAISGITLIAGILIYPNVGDDVLLKTIVLIGVAFATMNIVGGFSVTGRILEMFKKND